MQEAVNLQFARLTVISLGVELPGESLRDAESVGNATFITRSTTDLFSGFEKRSRVTEPAASDVKAVDCAA